jgi:8-oxo-dGTP pyrophosphatase MutT (NUDIX family)
MRAWKALSELMEPYPTFRTYSAGGVVFREVPSAAFAEQVVAKELVGAAQGGHALDLVEVALVGRSHSGMWALPKGTPRTGETIEQVAVREVQEETGLQVQLITYIGVVSYTFIRNQVRYFKQVRHFLFEAIGGDIALHDAEYDRVAWYPLPEAFRLMTYPNEANILSHAESILQRLLQRRQREGQV